MIKRTTKIALEIIGAFLAALLVLAAALAGRLSQGPIALTYFNPAIAESLRLAAPNLIIDVETTSLYWDQEAFSLSLKAKGVRLKDEKDATLAVLPEISAGLSTRALLFGTLAPNRIALIRPSLDLQRDENGHFNVGLVADSFDAENTDKPSATSSLLTRLFAVLQGDTAISRLSFLQEIEIRDGEALVSDQISRTSWWVPKANVLLKRSDNGLEGQADLSIELGKDVSHLSLTIDRPNREKTIQLAMNFENILLAPFAKAFPSAQGYLEINLPLSGEIFLTLTPEGKPLVLNADLRTGGQGGTKIAINAAFEPKGENVDIKGKVKLQNIDPNELSKLWPPAVGANAREWVLENIEQGKVTSGDVEFAAQMQEYDPDSFAPKSLKGNLAYENLTVHYVRPLPPSRDVSGTASFDLNHFILQIPRFTVEGVIGSDAVVDISGLSDPDQIVHITSNIEGNAPTILTLLDYQPFGYPSKRGIKPKDVRGEVKGQVKFSFPLLKDLKFEQINLAVTADLKKIYQQNAFLGLDLTRADLRLSLTQDEMEVAGQGYLSGLPLAVTWNENFRDKDTPYRRRFIVQATLDATAREIIGIPHLIPSTGPMEVAANYITFDNGAGNLSATLDLTKAGVAIPQINWTKNPGEAAHAKFELNLKNDVFTELVGAEINANDLTLQAKGSFFADGKRLKSLQISKMVTPLTDATIKLTEQENGDQTIIVRGKKLDATHLWQGRSASESKSAEPAASDPHPHATLTVDLELENLFLGGKESLHNVSARMVQRNKAYESANLRAITGKDTPVTVTVLPNPGGRLFSAHTNDAGSLLRALDVFDTMEGGVLDIEGKYNEKEKLRPLEGRILLRDFRVTKAPILARLLMLASITGIPELLSGPGLAFTEMKGKFTNDEEKLTITDMKAYGGSLGLTFEGQIAHSAGIANIRGNIIPAYVFNKIVGEIPIIGALITGGGDQPLIGFSYSIQGNLSSPKLSVNPLSALTPGFLRGIFGGGTPTVDTKDNESKSEPAQKDPQN